MFNKKPRTSWIQWIITLLAVVYSGISNATPVSFHGGYLGEDLSTDQHGSLSIRLTFRTLQRSGVLFLVRGSNSSLSLQVVDDGWLLLTQQVHGTSEPGGGHNASVGSMVEWRTIHLLLNNTALQLTVDDNLIFNHILSHSLTLQSVMFGGSASFFDPLYRHLPTPHFFIGCMRNISVGHTDVLLDTNVYGISEGCCIAPRYPAVCLNQTFPSLSLGLPPSSAAVFHLSFRLQLAHEGVVLSSESSSTAWLLQLTSGFLQLIANVSGTRLQLICPGDLLAAGAWHQVDLVLRQSSLSCAVNNLLPANRIIPVGTEWARTLIHVGGVELSPRLASLVDGVKNGFMGCIQRLRVDGVDVSPSVFVNSSRMKAVVKTDLVDWPQHHNTSELVVTEHMQERLTAEVLKLQVPQDDFRDTLSPLYQRELEHAIHLRAAFPPSYGRLFLGSPTVSVTDFSLHNILSSVENEQVGYCYTGGGNITDVVVFDVWVGCSDQRLLELPKLTLIITIEERGDEPQIACSRPLQLVLGTRMPVTTDVLLVYDPMTSNSTRILFTVKSVSVKDCGACLDRLCQDCSPAGVLFKGDMTAKFFTQDDVNNGLIAFQHYKRFSTDVVVVQLVATIRDINMDVEFQVYPLEGELKLVSDERQCLFVKEAGMTLVQPKHLTVESTFDNQSPVITYDLLTGPQYGDLQLWQPQTQDWTELSPNHTALHSLHSFTQADIRAGRVRYVQAAMNAGDFAEFEMGLDNFTYQVRSYNLSGPRGPLCINILPESILLQPSIAVQLSSLVLSRENSSAPITTANIKTSLENMDYQYLSEDSDYEIDVDQLGIVYHLVEPPSYGALELDSIILTAGDNFTLDNIRSQRLIYRHFGTENHQDSFMFYGEASSTAYLPIKAPNLTTNLSLVIIITATNNHEPVVTVLEPIRPPEGMAVRVTTRNLNVTDADEPAQPIDIVLRSLKKYTSIGRFALSRDPLHRLINFTMEHILNGSLLFVHQLNSSANLTAREGIKVKRTDGTYIKKVINIEAVPLDLTVSMTVSVNSTCVTEVAAEGTLQLDDSLFDVRLSDSHGNDNHLVGGVTVAVASSEHLGQLFLRRSDLSRAVTVVPVSEFQLRDINSVTYVLGNRSRLQTRDILGLRFTYGHSSPVVHYLTLCVRSVLEPISVQVSSLELMRGHLEHLAPQHILVTSSRPGEDGTLRVDILEQPRHGLLINPNKDGRLPLWNFTLDELRQQDIIYEYIGVAVTIATDHFVFQVCSESACLGASVLNITVYPVNITANDSQVKVREGSSYYFNISDFNLWIPGHLTEVNIVPKAPQYGNLRINTIGGPVEASYFSIEAIRRGRFFYEHILKENLQDYFEVLVEAEGELPENKRQSAEFIMWIIFEPVNDHPPEIVPLIPPTVQVVWGGSVLITSNILSAHDYDSHNHDNDLIWTVNNFYEGLSNGYFYLGQDPGPEGGFLSNWTEGDIRKDRLHYRHTGNMVRGDQTSDSFVLEVTDGKFKASAVLSISVKRIIIEQDGLLHFSVDEGASKTITHKYMHFSAQNVIIDDADFVITLTRPPSPHGKLLLNGATLHAGSEFSQNQTAEGQLVYAHDHSNTLHDSFVVSTSVPSRGNERKTSTFEITVRGLDDSAPEVTIHGPLYVLSAESVQITNQTMSIKDGDAITIQDFDKIVCQVTSSPTKGWLEKWKNNLHTEHTSNFTKYDLDNGSLYYRHLDDSLHPDYFIFNVSDGSNHQSQIYNLTIIILPLVVDVTLKTLTLSEGERAPITSEELQVSSIYLRDFKSIIMVLGAGPQYGRLMDSSTQETVTTFSTEDIAAGNVYYDHYGDETRTDSFTMKYVVLDPAGFNRTSDNLTFSIAISPVDDQPPVVNRPHTYLRLWARDVVPLTEAQFNVTDVDTAPNKLNFTVRVTQQDSYVAFANNTAQFIHWFTQADLRAGKVVLVHRNGPTGTIRYTVWDSQYNSSGSVTVRADQLTLDCQTTNWRSIKVQYLGSVPVSTDNIYCTTADDSMHREVLYSFSSAQLLGHFEVDSQIVTNFNSTTLQAGLVRYVHTEMVNWLEREELDVNVSSHPAVPAYNLSVLVDVEYPEPAPGRVLAVNQGLRLTEGGMRCFNSSILDGGNVRYNLWRQLNSSVWQLDQLRVQYLVEEGPAHGKLTVLGKPATSFTQDDLQDAHAVCYIHDDSEEHQDKILFKIQVTTRDNDPLGTASFEEVPIHASPVNDLIPVLDSELEKTLVQNFNSTLEAADLSLSDGDTPANLLFINLTLTPINVDIVVNGSLLNVGSRFSQNDVDLGRILLLPHHVGEAHFLFTYTDGNFTSHNSTTFRLQVEDHRLDLVNTEDITYAQDERRGTVITRHNLDTYTNGLTSQTVFTVQEGPMYGRLVMGETEVKNFTQEDIYSDKVSYIPYSGTQSYTDSFKLTVRNVNFTRQSFPMKVRVLVWGRVKPQTIGFDGQATPSPDGHLPAVPLPANVLVLDELEKDVKSRPINIRIMDGPEYGHLERHVREEGGTRQRRSSRELTEFRYEELEVQWIMYVWDYEMTLTNSTVQDVIKVLVLAPPYQPGEAVIHLNITPPLGYTPETATPSLASTIIPFTVSSTTSGFFSEGTDNGFPLFTLVPIVGIICFLVLLVAVMVCFCLFQQKHRNFKFSSPGSLHSPHQSLPWAASPSLPPGQLMTYDLDPSGGHLPGEDQQHNSETSSGFSEPDVSFHGSPVQSYPMYQSPSPSTYRQVPTHPRSRMMRSNVSITFSSPRSTTSELSYEDEVGRSRNLYTLSHPRYPASTVSTENPLPVRPSSHAGIRQPATAQREESGQQQLCMRQQQGHASELLQAGPNSDLDCNSFTALPDIRDHDLNALFHAPNPVLKKEEYWI